MRQLEVLREDFARSRAIISGGGALPPMGQGEQRSVGLLREGFAWNLAGTNAAAALAGCCVLLGLVFDAQPDVAGWCDAGAAAGAGRL